MSWFGFGGSSAPNKKEKGNLEVHDQPPSFPLENNDTKNPSGVGNNQSKFEQDVYAEQEKVLVQAVIFKLTELSFEQCVTKPTSQLSTAERNCISAVTTKYLETSQFVVSGLGPALMNQQRQS